MNILYPVFALSGLTLLLMARLGILRYMAVKSGSIDPRFFVLYRGYDEPEKLAVHSRHVINLFEAPLLFYLICISAYVTGQSGVVLVSLAWLYVALRFVHSYVHLTSNIVLRRFRVFIVSMLTLMAIWAIVLTGIMRA
jgi:hypothetical protein